MKGKKMKSLTQQLNYYISSIFANEQKFLDQFFPIPKWDAELELLECYFASERVKVVILNINSGEHISTTIPTMDIIDWVDNL